MASAASSLGTIVKLTRILVLLLFAVVLVSLVACGGHDDDTRAPAQNDPALARVADKCEESASSLDGMVDFAVQAISDDFGKSVSRVTMLNELDQSTLAGERVNCTERLATLIVLIGSE